MIQALWSQNYDSQAATLYQVDSSSILQQWHVIVLDCKRHIVQQYIHSSATYPDTLLKEIEYRQKHKKNEKKKVYTT